MQTFVLSESWQFFYTAYYVRNVGFLDDDGLL